MTSWLIREREKKHCKVKILLLPLFVIYKSYNDFFPWNIESIQSSGGQSTFIERVGYIDRTNYCCSVAKSDSLQPHGLRQARLLVLHYLPEFALIHVH